MRWWWIGWIGLAACDPALSDFVPDMSGTTDAGGIDAQPADIGSADARPLDMQIDADARPDAIADGAPAPDAAQDATPDALLDAAPDAAADAGPDAQLDAAPDAQLDAAPDTQLDAAQDSMLDAMSVDALLAPDEGPDGGHLDHGLPDGGDDGPFCGDQRRLPLDGIFRRAGPADQLDDRGCGMPQAAWSAFIELPEPRRVVLKTDGTIQRAADCAGGVGPCVSGSQVFQLPAGRTDFIISGTEDVRVRSTPACADGVDNDDDGRVDLDDAGCTDGADWTEVDLPAVAPACSNGRDDDGDGRADWPFDDRCRLPGSAIEACADSPPNARTSSTPGYLNLSALGGRPAALDCAPPGDTVDVLLIAPWGGRLTVRVDAVGAQAMEVRRGCNAVVDCTPADESGMTVRAGELVRVRIQGRPEWLTWAIAAPRQCANGLDDDADGRIDLQDPGCRHPEDDNEVDPGMPPVCSDGVDQDRDRARDFPEDFACAGPGGDTEVEACAAFPFSEADTVGNQIPRPFAAGSCGGADRPERRLTLQFGRPTQVRVEAGTTYARTDCARADTEADCVADGGVLGPLTGNATLYLEGAATLANPAFVPVRRCANGVDDDDDGQVDLADLGCSDPLDDDERDPPAAPACSDGIDNDNDGDIDWPEDEHCLGAGDANEAPRCLGTPDVGPVERLVLLGETNALPITHSLADGRPVRVALLPIVLDRPGQRRFPAIPDVQWIEMRACQPQPSAGFGEPLVLAGEGELTVRMEVDLEARPFIQVGALVPDCRNGFDDDGDGLIDSADPGCADLPQTEVDPPELPACADGLDNDGDGAIDAADPECLGVADRAEGGVCVSDRVARALTDSTVRWVALHSDAPRFGLACGPSTWSQTQVVPIEVAVPTRLTARTVQGMGDPVLSLEQDCGAALACADDGVDLQAELSADLMPGRYALRVGRWHTENRHPIQVDIRLEPLDP